MSGAVIMMMGGESFSVSASPPSVSVSGPDATLISPFVSAIVTGGVGPFSFSWSFSSPHPQIISVDPNSGSTRFQASGLFPGQTVAATAVCNAKDAATGMVETSNGVNIQFTRTDF